MPRFPRLLFMFVCSALALVPIASWATETTKESWQVTAIGPIEPGEAAEVTMEFTEGRIGGRGGCNRYFGPVTLTPLGPGAGTIAFGTLASTQMACAGESDHVEAAFHAALGQVTSYRIGGDGTLHLLAGDVTLIRARRN